MAQVKKKNKTRKIKIQEEMGGDALGWYLLFLKTNVSCTPDTSPLENKLHKEVVRVHCCPYWLPTVPGTE